MIEKQDLNGGFFGLWTNAKQMVTSVQDVARKLGDFANFTGKKRSSGKLYIWFLVCLLLLSPHSKCETNIVLFIIPWSLPM